MYAFRLSLFAMLLSSCWLPDMDSRKAPDVLFVDSSGFFDSCEVRVAALFFGFESELLTEENRGIFHRSVYQLDADTKLDVIFNNLQESEGLTSFPDDRIPEQIDTLSLTENATVFQGYSTPRYFLFSIVFDFGHAYLIFDFGAQIELAEAQKRFERYLETLGLDTHYYFDPPPTDRLSEPIVLAKDLLIIGKGMDLGKTSYAIFAPPTLEEDHCTDRYIHYYQLLKPHLSFFRSGDRLAIYTTNPFDDSKKIDPDPRLQLLFREDSGAMEEASLPINYFDCIAFDK